MFVPPHLRVGLPSISYVVSRVVSVVVYQESGSTFF